MSALRNALADRVAKLEQEVTTIAAQRNYFKMLADEYRQQNAALTVTLDQLRASTNHGQPITVQPVDRICPTCNRKHTGALSQCVACSSRGDS